MITTPVLHRLVELACLAPSVHNTQPWLWQAKDDGVRLYADWSRLLREEDPLGRNLMVSCGAALDHFGLAAHALGLDVKVSRFPEPADDGLLAEITVRPGEPSASAAQDIELLRTRCTDRRRFTSWPVPHSSLDQLAAAARSRGAAAVAVSDNGTRIRLELLVRRAHRLRTFDDAALAEQSRWVGRTGADGVPVAVLPSDPGPAAARFEAGRVAETRAVVDSSDGLIVIGAADDDRPSWLRTGEALSTLWIRATHDGLSVVPLSLPIEVEAVRTALQEGVLGNELSPHLLVRIGWQAIGRSELPRTPRRPLADVLIG